VAKGTSDVRAVEPPPSSSVSHALFHVSVSGYELLAFLLRELVACVPALLPHMQLPSFFFRTHPELALFPNHYFLVGGELIWFLEICLCDPHLGSLVFGQFMDFFEAQPKAILRQLSKSFYLFLNISVEFCHIIRFNPLMNSLPTVFTF